MNTTISVSTTRASAIPISTCLAVTLSRRASSSPLSSVAVECRIDVVGHRVTALATAPNAEPAATSATKWLPVPTTTAATATG